MTGLLQVRDHYSEARIREISRYLLVCAEYEAGMLVRDLGRIGLRPRGLWGRRKSVLTSVAVRQAQLTIRYRLRSLGWQEGQRACKRWPVKLDKMEEELRKIGYAANRSRNWLEHYNAACYHALALVGDEEECLQHMGMRLRLLPHLDRAAQFGDNSNS